MKNNQDVAEHSVVNSLVLARSLLDLKDRTHHKGAGVSADHLFESANTQRTANAKENAIDRFIQTGLRA